MERVFHLILWLFIGALVVLIVTHAEGFASAVQAVGGTITDDASLLTGAGVPAGSTQATTSAYRGGGGKAFGYGAGGGAARGIGSAFAA